MTAHITREVQRDKLIDYCGKEHDIPEHLQSRITVGEPNHLNPEQSDCGPCWTKYCKAKGVNPATRAYTPKSQSVPAEVHPTPRPGRPRP